MGMESSHHICLLWTEGDDEEYMRLFCDVYKQIYIEKETILVWRFWKWKIAKEREKIAKDRGQHKITGI